MGPWILLSLWFLTGFGVGSGGEMGVGYWLVNFTKKEQLVYSHVPAASARELAGNPVAAAITTWYLLRNLGDAISFVSDTHEDWPFPEGNRHDMDDYKEVTDEVVNQLMEQGLLVDDGRDVFWEDEPEVYLRRLRNVWVAS
jgi:hypothetical protein